MKLDGKRHTLARFISRSIRDELKELIISESGRPTHRYSLRLSSQLMLGLVRLYRRKAQSLLSDLCLIEANVIIHAKKKRNVGDDEECDEAEARPRARAGPGPGRAGVPECRRKRPSTAVLQPVSCADVLPPDERDDLGQRIEEILQNSSNVVNIQDITLTEAVFSEPAPPPNEGFGEENLEQALEFLSSRRSVEQMMSQRAAGEHHSALEPLADTTDKSHDRTRLAPRGLDMESMSVHDLTLLRPSDGGVLSTTDIGREIPESPDVPIPPIPEKPDPREIQARATEVEMPEGPIEEPRDTARATERAARESTQIELEELEEIEPRVKRRRKLIIDKKTQLSSDFLRQRIQDPHVEIRVETISDLYQVPYDVYMNRPCRAGFKEHSNIALPLTRLFMRNLGYINRDSAHRQFQEQEMQRQQSNQARQHSEINPEVEERPTIAELQIERVQETSAIIEENLAPPELDVTRANVTEQQDIADMVTQKLETLSQHQETRKRSSDEATTSSKRQKSGSNLPLRENQPRLRESQPAMARPENEMRPEDMEVDKENIAANQQAIGFVRISSKISAERRATALLQESGLSDIPLQVPVETEPGRPEPQTMPPEKRQSRRQGSDSSETPLGSLDRTKVSLGDSVQTTESMKRIREEWGTEGTMVKIIKCLRRKSRGDTITINTLIAIQPAINEYKNIIAAKCFSSILKLKQHGFIKVQKCPNTLEILDIMIGPKILMDLD